ncbi:MAG: helix-turn-helix domain-containing protein [Ktedonobacteraceae bacterium]|nr:helix-turn-helix domain-containing protein [Ktedonobacteraceae bacterium]
MRLNLQREWYEGEAKKEEQLEVTAGFRDMRFPDEVEEVPEKIMTSSNVSAIPFGRLISLQRRQHRLSMEQLAEKADVDLGELVTIEAGQCSTPQARTVYALAQALNLPSDKLYVVSGLKFSTDQAFNKQAVRFAARSEAVDKLSKEEQQALQEFVKYLSEK